MLHIFLSVKFLSGLVITTLDIDKSFTNTRQKIKFAPMNLLIESEVFRLLRKVDYLHNDDETR